MFTIDKQVALPSGKSKYPFASMDKEDSFFIPSDERGTKRVVVAVRQAAKRYAQGTGLRFLTRVVDNGVRVWRVE